MKIEGAAWIAKMGFLAVESLPGSPVDCENHTIAEKLGKEADSRQTITYESMLGQRLGAYYMHACQGFE